jgi:hypothetical protein
MDTVLSMDVLWMDDRERKLFACPTFSIALSVERSRSIPGLNRTVMQSAAVRRAKAILTAKSKHPYNPHAA